MINIVSDCVPRNTFISIVYYNSSHTSGECNQVNVQVCVDVNTLIFFTIPCNRQPSTFEATKEWLLQFYPTRNSNDENSLMTRAEVN